VNSIKIKTLSILLGMVLLSSVTLNPTQFAKAITESIAISMTSPTAGQEFAADATIPVTGTITPTDVMLTAANISIDGVPTPLGDPELDPDLPTHMPVTVNTELLSLELGTHTVCIGATGLGLSAGETVSNFECVTITVSAPNFCHCEQSRIELDIDKGKLKPTVPITVKVGTRTKAGEIPVTITLNLLGTIRCSVGAVPDCLEHWILDQESSKWIVDFTKNKKTGQEQGGTPGAPKDEEFKNSDGKLFLECVGDQCNKVFEKKFATTYSVKLPTASTNFIKGEVLLKVRGESHCDQSDSITSKIAVDSSFKGDYNPDLSDIDGDGLNGHQEKALGTSDLLFNESTSGNTGPDQDKDGDGIINKNDPEPTDPSIP